MKIILLQLGLLIWKCWKTESRKKIRLVCQIVFPLFMFLIVVAVRKSLDLRKSQHECHFGAKPLISAGIIPFLQGVVCNANNTCHPSKTQGENNVYPFNKTLIPLFKLPTYSRLQSTRKRKTTTTTTTTTTPEPSVTYGNAELFDSVSQFWNSLCDEPFPAAAGQSSSSPSTTTEKAQQAGSPSQQEAEDLSFGRFNPKRCMAIRAPIRRISVNPAANDTSDDEAAALLECRRFICMLQSVTPLWATLSRLLMGRIVYYPNSTVVNTLMSRVERSLNWVGVLREALHVAQLYSRFTNGANDRQTNQTTRFASLLGCLFSERNRFQGTDSVESLISTSMRLHRFRRLTAAVHFYDADKLTGDQLPSVVRYSLRLDPSNLDPTTRIKDRPFNIRVRRHPMREMPYFLTGFIYLQDAIDKVIIKMHAEQEGKVEPLTGYPVYAQLGTIMQQFPYPCYLEDLFLQVLANQLTMYVVLGWIFLAAIIVKSIVLEKERKLREVARIMGISPGLHFLSWFVFWACLMFATVLLFLIILKAGDIFVHASSGVIVVFMTAYSFATISFCFFTSSFFNRANVAAVVSGLVYFLTFIAYAGINSSNGESMNLPRMLASSLLPNVALGFGWQVIANYELSTEGSSFANFCRPISDEPSDQFTMAHAMACLLLDCFLYYFLAWYIDYVFPGEFGVPHPFYFFLQPSFWCGSSNCNSYHLKCCRVDATDELLPTIDGSLQFECEPSHLKIGCALKSVTKIYNFGVSQRIRSWLTRDKTYKGRKAAVDHLTVNMYESQITALLGHNGAGKTTAMSIMTGMIPATSGSVSVYDHDVARELATVRRTMGFCPQFNVLYDELTVSEHMWFYARIRGLSSAYVASQVEQMLRDTDLTLKRSEASKVLSGGMRRRLSIAVAFIGNAKCVILDEPTAGVDPYARRSIWDLLAKFRTGRTIVLSTHHMDEAEILGDRIAIISHGRLKTCGSPLFLKEIHGEGYRLTVVRDKDTASEASSAILSEADHQHEAIITDFLTRHLSLSICSLISHAGVEIKYSLGYEELGKFAGLFNQLEAAKARLRISTYGLSDTTLEEIFIKITEQADDAKANLSDKAAAANDAVEEPVKYENLTGIKLVVLQFYGLLVKRYHRMRRSWKGFIVELLLPVVFVLLGVIIIKVAEFKPGNPPPLELTPWLLAPGPQSTRDQRLYTFFSEVGAAAKRFQEANKVLGEASATADYVGTRCMDPLANYSIQNLPCISEAKLTWNESIWMTRERYRQRNCSCTDDGVQQCAAESKYPLPMLRHLRTGDDVLNLTGSDVSQYIIDQYKSMKHNLYGGTSFTIPKPPASAAMPRLFRSPKPQDPLLFAPGSLSIWFNNKGWLSSVAYLNYVNNMLLRLTVSESVDSPNSTYGIVTYNHPLNYTSRQFGERLQAAAFIDVMLAIMLILAFSFVPASFVMFLIEDRVSDSKHVQLVSGLRPAVYWLANYTWDCLNYLFPVTACLIIFIAFDVEAYINENSAYAFVLLVAMYGFAVAPMLYPTSLYFTTPSTAFVVLACASLFFGSGTTIATWFLDLLYIRERDDSLENVNSFLKVFFFIFPQYCFGRGLINLAISYRRAQGNSFFFGTDIQGHKPFSWDVCGQCLLALFLHNICWLAVNMLLAYYLPLIKGKVVVGHVKARRLLGRSWRRLRACCSASLKNEVQDANSAPHQGSEATEEADADVLNEQDTILNEAFDSNAYTLVVKNLTKHFETSRGRLTAVDRLTFGVPAGQCFGLLGLNGAGKSTTFNMLTGLVMPSSGTAFIGKYNITSSRNKVNQLIGYCPQYDCITPLLSGRENLEFFARIRGIPERFVKKTAEASLRRMDLTAHADKPTQAYSGGNKRKLSVAIACMGEPSVILLDEPSAGIDPRARRHLWKAVSALLRHGQSVILTTHSMDECEALCTRLAIMVNGRFRCLGSPQHLKARFGEGYLLTLRFPSTTDRCQLHERALNELKRLFGDAVLKESHDTVAIVALGVSGQEPVDLGKLFAFLTDAQVAAALGFTDYSLMQSSLDAVFVTFAKAQRQEDAEQ